MATIRLTTAQAIIRFLKNQYVRRDDQEIQFFAGILGIFGHGNVAGIGQALAGKPRLPLYPRPQRAVSRAFCGGLHQNEKPDADLCLHLLDWSRGDEYDHRRSAGDDQPPAGAAAAR